MADLAPTHPTGPTPSPGGQTGHQGFRPHAVIEGVRHDWEPTGSSVVGRGTRQAPGRPARAAAFVAARPDPPGLER